MKALFAAAVIVASVPVVSAFAAGPDTKASEGKSGDRVCRIVRDRTSASRLGPRRVCMSSRQWNQTHEADVDGEMDALGPRTRGQGRPELPQ